MLVRTLFGSVLMSGFFAAMLELWANGSIVLGVLLLVLYPRRQGR